MLKIQALALAVKNPGHFFTPYGWHGDSIYYYDKTKSFWIVEKYKSYEITEDTKYDLELLWKSSSLLNDYWYPKGTYDSKLDQISEGNNMLKIEAICYAVCHEGEKVTDDNNQYYVFENNKLYYGYNRKKVISKYSCELDQPGWKVMNKKEEKENLSTDEYVSFLEALNWIINNPKDRIHSNVMNYPYFYYYFDGTSIRNESHNFVSQSLRDLNDKRWKIVKHYDLDGARAVEAAIDGKFLESDLEIGIEYGTNGILVTCDAKVFKEKHWRIK